MLLESLRKMYHGDRSQDGQVDADGQVQAELETYRGISLLLRNVEGNIANK